jgi:hypothetical protein
MKTFKLRVIETWIGGTKEARIIEIRARDEMSAIKKARRIQGNRDWEIEVLK